MEIMLNFSMYSALINPEIVKHIGKAIYLLLWCFDKTTFISRGVGLVLGGKQITLDEIGKDLGVHNNTIKAWSKTLKQYGFIYYIAGYGGVRRWFALGYYKKIKKKKLYEYQSKIINQVLKEVNDQIQRSNQTILNPLFSYLELKSSENTEFSSSENSNTVPQQTENGLISLDNTNDNTGDNTDDNKNDVFLARKKEPDTPCNLSSDGKRIFTKYMEMLGSKRNIPSKDEVSKIAEVLSYEDVEALIGVIEKYFKWVGKKTGYRPYSLNKFLDNNFYEQFIRGERESDDYSKRYVPASGWDVPERYR